MRGSTCINRAGNPRKSRSVGKLWWALVSAGLTGPAFAGLRKPPVILRHREEPTPRLVRHVERVQWTLSTWRTRRGVGTRIDLFNSHRFVAVCCCRCRYAEDIVVVDEPLVVHRGGELV